MRYFTPVEDLTAVQQNKLAAIILKGLYGRLIAYRNRWKLRFSEAIETLYFDEIKSTEMEEIHGNQG